MLEMNKHIPQSKNQTMEQQMPFSNMGMSRVGVVFALVSVAAITLAGCSSSSKKSSYDPKYGVSASARVATKSSQFKKGGGTYKIGKPYKVAGRTYVPKDQPSYNKVGKASWYGDDFHGRLTANGEIFDMHSLTAAHPTLPLPSYVRVTNMKNGRSTLVRVNDRGPYAHNRIIDLSKRVAQKLGFINDGIANVRVQYVGKARLDGHDTAFLEASYREKGQPIGNDKIGLPSNGNGGAGAPPVMIASASGPKSKPETQQTDFLLANLPQLGAPDATAYAPAQIDLTASTAAGWAPVDLVGDGYFPPEGMGNIAAPVELASFAPVQLNYAPETSKRVEAGYEAINDLLKGDDQTGLSKALKRKAQAMESANRAKNEYLASHSAELSNIGQFDSEYGLRLAKEFAMLAAVDITDQPDGSISLSISKLKDGVSWQDIASLRQRLGLS